MIKNLSFISFLSLAMLLVAPLVSWAGENDTLIIFSSPSCGPCQVLKAELATGALKEWGQSLKKIYYVDISKPEGYRLLSKYTKDMRVPTIVIGEEKVDSGKRTFLIKKTVTGYSSPSQLKGALEYDE